METYIYALRDPLTQEIRYIGKSNNPKNRLSFHLALSDVDTNGHKKNWIKQLKDAGERPILEIIEACDYSEWEERETYWIAEGRRRGWPLTNMLVGGAGHSDKDPDLELVEALQMYLDKDKWHLLDEQPIERLQFIALWMARESMPYSKGMFTGKCQTLDIAYNTSRGILYEALGL